MDGHMETIANAIGKMSSSFSVVSRWSRGLSAACIWYRYDGRRWLKVGEAVMIAALSAVIFMILIYAVPNCKPIRGFHDPEAPVNATGHLPTGNATDNDVIAVHDVTRETTESTHASDDEHHDEHDDDHGGHGEIFQVGNTL